MSGVDFWIDANGAWNLSRQVGANTQTSKSANGAAVLGTAYHVVAVFPQNANHRLFVNGEEVVLTHTGSAINGALSIGSGDEIAIGAPTPTSLTGMAGKIGRVVLWPYAMGATQATVSYRHQSAPSRWIGIGGENQAGESNRAPVAVPFRYTITPGGSATINVRARAYDPDGETPSIVSGSLVASTGTASLSGGDIVASVPASAANGSEQTVSFTLRDGNDKRSTGKVYGTVRALGSARSYFYKYPGAASLEVGRIKPWAIGNALPTHEQGDTILAYGPLSALTGDAYGKGGLKGSLVLMGATFNPTPRLYGVDSRNPIGAGYRAYMGVNNIFDFLFDATARHHTSWEVEPGLTVDWPIVYFCNIAIDWSVNGCSFGDFLRCGNAGSSPNDTTSKALRGRKTVAFFNKVRVNRGPFYADDECDAAGTTILRQTQFHSDGIQTKKGLVGWRVADSHFDWVMGQNFFCGVVPEDEGFPRTIRQRYANVSWQHSAPWALKAPNLYQPDPSVWDTGDVRRNPRMVMNYEGGFSGTPVETSDYGNGKYWAAHFERSCYIKSKYTLNNAENQFYLAPGGNGGSASAPNNNGILSRPKTGTSGQYGFSGEVKTSHTYPAWSCASGASVTLMDNTQTLPVTCPADHVGYSLRVTTAAEALAILQA